MAATPTDQTRHFDYDPGKGKTVIDSLAAPPATAVSAATRADSLTKTGNPTGTGAGKNTKRPASGSTWITGGTVSGVGTVAAGSTPAPPQYAQRDAYRNQGDTASVAGPPAPVVTAGATGGTSPAATVVLNWAAVPTATGYKIEKSVKSGAVFGPWVAGVPPTVGAVLTVTETGLSTGDVRFRVTATGGVKDSPASNPVTVTIP